MVGEDADLMLRLGVAPNMVKIDSPWLFAYRIHPQMFTSGREAWALGARQFMRRYRSGVFPGGRARDAEVLKTVTGGIGYYAHGCLVRGGLPEFLGIFLNSIGLHLRARNYHYLFITPAQFRGVLDASIVEEAQAVLNQHAQGEQSSRCNAVGAIAALFYQAHVSVMAWWSGKRAATVRHAVATWGDWSSEVISEAAHRAQ